VITSRDTFDTFHYVDPPYIGSNMGHYSGYTDSQYEELLSVLANCQGKFLLSGYRSTILERFIVDQKWHVGYYDKQLSASVNKAKRKVEVLVGNFSFLPNSG
jgi:DNA adenine methylase